MRYPFSNANDDGTNKATGCISKFLHMHEYIFIYMNIYKYIDTDIVCMCFGLGK